MKFSVLLPTRDRLELLKLAVESVRAQEDADWELVVSDNASQADVGGYLRSLNDARILFRRFEQTVPVTDNWNAALELATGDYLIMLGDDDALLPGALAEARRLIEGWGRPEALYAQARQYAYPNVIPGHPEAFMQTGYSALLGESRAPFHVARAQALRMVRGAMSFRVLYGFNMQHFVVSRRLVERLAQRGPFFQSPYPDYYAANAVLLAADPLIATPRPLALIGISLKSFGFYYFNAREADGVAFLQSYPDAEVAARLRGQLVPGSNMNDSWLCAMETLAKNFHEVPGLRVRYARYRRLQYHEMLKARPPGGRLGITRHMRPWEWVFFGAAAAAYALASLLPRRARRSLREAMIRGLFSPSPRFDPGKTTVPYRDILEAARAHAR